MRRVGIDEQLGALSEPVASYVTLLSADFATSTEESGHERNRAIVRFVKHNGGPMGAAVDKIYLGDYLLFYSGFYLLRPSSSDMRDATRACYASASHTLSKVTLVPGKFFRVMEENIDGLLDALAAVSSEVMKPSVSARPFHALLKRRLQDMEL